MQIVAAIWSFVLGAAQRRGPAARERPPCDELPTAKPRTGAALTPQEIYGRVHELAFGVAPLGRPESPRHRRVAAETAAALETAAAQPRHIPRRPMLLPELMRALNDADAGGRELARIIARDPALTGSLLKLANSPYYRVGPRPIESIERAVTVLGSEGIRSVAAAALVLPVFNVAGGEFARFPEIAWEQTLRTADASEAHAALAGGSDPLAAQLLGLVAGLGAIIVFRVALERYAAHPKLRPHPAVIAGLLDAHAIGAAWSTAASWGLSGRILEALEDQRPPSALHEPTPLGHSLAFGRLAGALAVLHAHGRVDDDTAWASMVASGASGAQFERVWKRLTARPQKR